MSRPEAGAHSAGSGGAWADQPAFADPRGLLVPVEHDGLPFVPRRTFVIVSGPAGTVRGEHATPDCEELLVLVRGSVRVTLGDPPLAPPRLLDRPGQSHHVPAGTHVRLVFPDADGVLLVLASARYRSAGAADRAAGEPQRAGGTT